VGQPKQRGSLWWG